jgi:prolipoprotein diacylglyceryltransferase
VTYGAARFLSEQFRQADDGVLTIGFLTLPMMLSVSMMVLGVAVLWRIACSNALRIGGLLPLSGRTPAPTSPTPAARV